MKKINIISLALFFIIACTGLPCLDAIISCDFFNFSKAEAARKNKKSSKNSKKSSKTETKSTEKNESNEDLGLLVDSDKTKSYMPDIYRCSECGYEQDEEGFCPDHSTLKLVKIISNQNDPLAPAELDGNEDILVDIPLNIQFKKDDIESDKTEDSSIKNKKSESKDKNKKSKSK